MAEVRAAYRRTFQVASYESETVELSIADNVDSGGRDALVQAVADLYAALAEVGDRVVAERMAAAPRKPAPERASGDPNAMRKMW